MCCECRSGEGGVVEHMLDVGREILNDELSRSYYRASREFAALCHS